MGTSLAERRMAARESLHLLHQSPNERPAWTRMREDEWEADQASWAVTVSARCSVEVEVEVEVEVAES